MADLIDINEERKKKQHSKPVKEKVLKAKIMEDICFLLSGVHDCVPERLGRWPYKLLVVKQKLDDEPLILKVDETNVAHVHSTDALAGELFTHLRIHQAANPDKFPWAFPIKECSEAVKTWKLSVQSTKDMPKSIGYLSDPETLFYRLPFDPDNSCCDELSFQFLAPTWAEVVGRVQNPEGFCGRIGSIMDMDADRKQALWISGPKDSGKSQIAKQLKILGGGSALGGGAFHTMSDTDLQDKFFKAEMIGKRVVVMNEVSPKFINSEEFKSITGDDDHRVRPCGQQGFYAKLQPLLFFFSNTAPETQSKQELYERIIYCRIDGLPVGTKKIGPIKYQQLLTDELPSFMGYCSAVYGRYIGESLPNDSEEMLEVIQDKESEQESFFQKWFIVDPNGEILSDRFEEILCREAKNDRHWYKAYIRRTYGSNMRGSSRSDRRRRYVGFRERRIEERKHLGLDF